MLVAFFFLPIADEVEFFFVSFAFGIIRDVLIVKADLLCLFRLFEQNFPYKKPKKKKSDANVNQKE